VFHNTASNGHRCPDCTATAPPGDVLRHVWSCPVAVADRVQLVDDLRWFREHRGAPYRSRPTTWADREALRMLGFDADAARRMEVLVRRVGPGMRDLLYVLDGALVGGSADLGEVPR